MKAFFHPFLPGLFAGLILVLYSCQNSPSPVITGDLKPWHTVTITFNGPETSEYDTLNPFTDYRLDVTFTNDSLSYTVPGYFAADGNAAETSAKSGRKWRAHFCPPAEGTWKYTVSFLKGRNISISNNPAYGTKGYMDGYSGNFVVEKGDPEAPGFLSKGRLQYNGTHFLEHAGSGELFLKGGADSPENFLGYRDFDATYYGGYKSARLGEAAVNHGLHRYEPHIADWKDGDPQWQNGKGKGIIGALNYLSSKGVNSFYFLTLNILGDGEDVWPYTDRNERYRFDCSKLDQWEIVFSHADRMGLMLHFVLQETENELLLDGGYLDVQRKLYLRELVARFSHHLAITWNLGEEHHPVHFAPYGQTYHDTKLMANYLHNLDPYKNFIAIHTHASKAKRLEDMTQYLGFKSVFGPSLQIGNIKEVHEETKFWLKASADSLHPWVVCTDEIGQAWKGALPDAIDPGHDTIRRQVLWGNLMAGGAGVEWYFGYNYEHNDLNCEDFRSRDILWDQTRFALDFFRRYLPFHEMINDNDRTTATDDYCLIKENILYAIYLPNGEPTSISLPEGNFEVHWYNPRTGGDPLCGKVSSLIGPGLCSTGHPPFADGKDWVCLIRKI